MSSADATQLRMPFETPNTVREQLRSGTFSVFLEYEAPVASESVLKLALAPGIELARFAADHPRVTGLAVGPNRGSAASVPVVEIARHLREHCQKDLIAYIVGRQLTEAQLRDQVAALRSAAVSSIVAITGAAGTGDPGITFMDACRIVRSVREYAPDVFVGAGVNPFKYTAEDSHLQYYRMVRKLGCGAGFLVTQAGWDMKKYQELQWYTRSRHLDDPVIARLLLVPPAAVTEMAARSPGGIVISRELAATMQRDATVNDVQGMVAQMRRLALLAAGCKLVGYSGIQLAGVPDARTAAALLAGVFEAFTELHEYDRWLHAWRDFHDRIELAPYPHRYYVFQKLLTPEHMHYVEGETPFTGVQLPAPSLWDRLRAHFSPEARSKPVPRCPKGLESGACGGSRPDGTCEFGGHPCVFHRLLLMLNWCNELQQLETPND